MIFYLKNNETARGICDVLVTSPVQQLRRQMGPLRLWRRRFRQPNVTDDGEAAEITIGTEIIAPHPERFGANIDIRDYAPWAPNALAFNNWVADGGMEPLILRYKGTATGGSSSSIENNAGPTTTAGGMIADGFFDGADVRVYRTVDERVQLLRTSKVARYLASASSGYQIVLDGQGPAVQAGDIYFLSLICADAPVDKVHPRLATLATADTWQIWGDRASITTRRDASTVAPAHGSRTSLRITNTSDREGGIYQDIAGASSQNVFNAFDPRRRYRLTVWLKQEGVPGGTVEIRVAPYRETIHRTFTVTDHWACYQFTFTGPRHLAGSVAHLRITSRGPGTLWVDDVQLCDTRQPPYALRPEMIQAFRDFQPGVLRIWSGHTNIAWGTTLDNWLAREGQGMRFWEPRRGPVPGALFSLPTALAFARATGATPWLIVHPSFDEAEWRGLVEYLAGPPTSCLGARRAAHGQVRPWTDEFSRIRIEMGNETWNSELFRPWTFDTGTQYGQFADYCITIATSSPYYPSVAGKIDFILGGWALSAGPRGYGARARQASTSASFIGVSLYLTGWRRFHLPFRTSEQQFQNTLVYGPWITHYVADQQAATLRLLMKMGFPARLATPEGGPDYTFVSPEAANYPAAERAGTSLAAGVSVLDMFLHSTALGFGPQAYYLWGVSPRWASHTAWNNGYRPHPTWLALQMRNRYAVGDLVATTIIGGGQIDLPAMTSRTTSDDPTEVVYRIPAQPGVPMMAAYTFRHGSRYALFVLSRHLSRTIPITVHLPACPLAATLYTLTGDPRANNLDALRITIRQHRVRHITQDYAFAMPPGSIYLFVIDTDRSRRDPQHT